MKGTLTKVREAVRVCHDRIILTGTIAVSSQTSLRDAEEAMEELVRQGVLRRAESRELFTTDVISAYVKV